MPNLYIIAGCNGAGKTTASYTILPEMLNCKEFVNADGIAAGLSPFNPEKVAIEAGRIMLSRIDSLLDDGVDFAIETTLASKSYVSLIKEASAIGYKITLVYFWLSSPQEAKQRVATRVSKGGHHIPDDVIERRYIKGIYNLIHLYLNICDYWAVFNNEAGRPEIVVSGEFNNPQMIFNSDIWKRIKKQSDETGKY
ncbi:zeta toxin family protein [Mucilaginibacter xinganensis]|uniref:Zeta toxin n=1 Tax=Mucilaginibacter xinganensis TaxID=1234841 RepID=A0A223P1F2_9SPHI|nr:zeta toxin family protein [Mucilaginibacter xinganensis]ASU35916.1 zeta toxin [Mucilaginibacter xinganensis]